MLDRYNIVGEAETAAALALADRYLSAQPNARNVEEGQVGDNRDAVGAEVVARQRVLAEAGGNQTRAAASRQTTRYKTVNDLGPVEGRRLALICPPSPGVYA
jgi:hypothetical protein